MMQQNQTSYLEYKDAIENIRKLANHRHGFLSRIKNIITVDKVTEKYFYKADNIEQITLPDDEKLVR
jgi:hypothetical protein